jgi:hypothetical protein
LTVLVSHAISMKLRDHPFMTRRSGIRLWPPLWVNIDEPHDKPAGEIGTLLRVLVADAIRDALFIWVQHNGLEYVGGLYFDDAGFCYEIHRVLEANIGHTIEGIGDIDLSYML